MSLTCEPAGIEPPPAVCQRHKSAAIPTAPRGRLEGGPNSVSKKSYQFQVLPHVPACFDHYTLSFSVMLMKGFQSLQSTRFEARRGPGRGHASDAKCIGTGPFFWSSKRDKKQAHKNGPPCPSVYKTSKVTNQMQNQSKPKTSFFPSNAY